ncbi:Feruloyl esterase [Paraburkholderia sacchari]|uniref:tannase/feruloyl esterase family alpha/beta hydrolase n=1 Tax=Paraburkholderia sacchari TaxID=159450 RepID=UPI0039A6D79A
MGSKIANGLAGAALASLMTTVVLTGCGPDGGSSDVVSTPTLLSCDDTMKTAFKPDAQTQVILVKQIKKGDPIQAQSYSTTTTPASADVCLVKLVVGPGHLGPTGAPSTSVGIGMEIWLPSKGAWNHRLHAIGNGGWGGSSESDPTKYSIQAATSDNRTGALIASTEGAVAVNSDTGHQPYKADVTNYTGDGSFAMNPDGTINTTLWTDFAYRANHEQVVRAKALAQAYYGSAPKYTYWDGGSTGGRQGLKQAQTYPEDYDGILVGYPAINWTRFMTGMVYPAIVVAQDLLGQGLTSAQTTLVSQAAISACDIEGGQHLGFILNPDACHYDPTKDTTVLCASDGGSNSTTSCVSKTQAAVIDKAWYGMTADGSVPDPAVDNGWSASLSANQRWYGYARGTSIGLPGTAASVYTAQVALSLQSSKIADSTFINATGNGQNGYKQLSYAQLNDAFDQGLALNPSSFAGINTDDPDLSKFKARGGKLIHYASGNDELIPAQGSINYYNRVLAAMGGVSQVQSFYRFFILPGNGHGDANGTANPNANPPTVAPGQMYKALTDWVENGAPPDGVVFQSASTTPVAKSLPICFYPKKLSYVSGSVYAASSFACQ